MNSLVLGGTSGIGLATTELLRSKGWSVIAYGRNQYDVRYPSNRDEYNLKQDAYKLGGYDAFVYCAGSLTEVGLSAFAFAMRFYDIPTKHSSLFNHNCCIIAVSSVAVIKPAKVNPDYAAAKAALESYALTLKYSDIAKQRNWRVEVIMFDLVHTRMFDLLPKPIDMTNRVYITPEVAAQRIVTLIGVE